MGDHRCCRGCGTLFVPARPYHQFCGWECWQSSASNPPPEVRPAKPLLTAATLRDAVRLCHPDAQPPERLEQATRTTQALTVALAQVRELEAAA